MSSNSFQRNIWQMDPLENWPLLKSNVQIPKVSGLRWAFSPSSCRAFHSIPSDLHQFEVQWWLSSVILQKDVNLGITSFRLCKIKRLKVLSPWFPASWARSRSSTNPAFYTDFSPLLDFSGSAGFGTWRIFVPLFWATCRLFSISLLFQILERFYLWILLLCLPLSFWDTYGSNFCMVFLLTLFYPLSFCDKKGGVIFYLDRDCIFNRTSDFCPKMAKGGVF